MQTYKTYLKIPFVLVVARSNSKGIFVFKITMEKKCTKCGEVKSLDEFSNNKGGKFNKSSRCKICYSKYYKDYSKKNAVKIKQKDKKYREKLNKKKKNNISTLQFIELFEKNNGLNKCNKCREVKSLDEFYNQKTARNGKTSHCKNCVDKHVKEYSIKNKEKISKDRKDYYELNKEKLSKKSKKWRIKNKEYLKKYREENKEKRNQQNKEWRINNKEKNSKTTKNWKKKNKEKISKYRKDYYELNKEKINTRINIYNTLRRKQDPLFKLACDIRKRTGRSLRNKGYTKKTRTYNILKCEYDFFIEFLNGVASNGYTYGVGNLHLDHVIPISLAETEDECILLNHYSNFQLLSAFDNISKGNRTVNPINLKRVLEHHPEPNKIKEIYSRL